MERAADVKRIREESFYLSAQARIPVPIGRPVRIACRTIYANKRGMTDPMAEVPTVKAFIDGALEDRGCIPNDTGEWVKNVSFDAPVVIGEDKTIWIPGFRGFFKSPGVIVTVDTSEVSCNLGDLYVVRDAK